MKNLIKKPLITALLMVSSTAVFANDKAEKIAEESCACLEEPHKEVKKKITEMVNAGADAQKLMMSLGSLQQITDPCRAKIAKKYPEMNPPMNPQMNNMKGMEMMMAVMKITDKKCPDPMMQVMEKLGPQMMNMPMPEGMPMPQEMPMPQDNKKNG